VTDDTFTPSLPDNGGRKIVYAGRPVAVFRHDCKNRRSYYVHGPKGCDPHTHAQITDWWGGVQPLNLPKSAKKHIRQAEEGIKQWDQAMADIYALYPTTR
jgi:hypothetical protein